MGTPFEQTQGKLSIVATPIGNLEDITLRALRTLKECDVIYAEDTRVISKLLARYEIKKPLQRLDAAMESKRADQIVERLEAGERVAFVSDAGTPGISDPGARLVAQVRAQLLGAKIEAIPGASALTAALSIAGLDTAEFIFLGFLPHKKGRQTTLKQIAEMVRKDSPQGGIPVVLYESPHRIEKLLKELEVLGVSRVTIARELTKIHEEVLSGTPAELLAHFAACPDTVRGEFVVIVTP
ncbi:MAG: 16S rRNA (cytidine(1402)-2'-O)-methyltransferase [Patescibacteria group bacterium]|nr:16S rRNA (cytidine(1402)-2'-O)-methyltransferase [Patescibacteria group bacterium]